MSSNAVKANPWLHVGITMPKAWFFENAFIPRKALVEVKDLQKVFSKHIYEI